MVWCLVYREGGSSAYVPEHVTQPPWRVQVARIRSESVSVMPCESKGPHPPEPYRSEV